MVAIMIKKDNLSTDLLLQSPRSLDFGKKKSLRKNSTRLLAETNGWIRHGDQAGIGSARNIVLCKTTASKTTAAQPMALYHR
jgi:hypothetical protein